MLDELTFPLPTLASLGGFLGMHYPESRFYLRRVRLSSDADVLGPLRDAGYRFGNAGPLVIRTKYEVVQSTK